MQISRNVIIGTDQNQNLLNINTDKNVKTFVHNLLEEGFLPLVFLPTRISNNTETLIDNIYILNIKILTIIPRY